MTTPAAAVPGPAPVPEDPDQPCSAEELLDAWTGIARGFTQVADRLEQAGLIVRQPSPSDRRVTNAVLTPAGRATADRALAVYCATLRELVLSHLGTDGLRGMVGQMSLLGDLPP